MSEFDQNQQYSLQNQQQFDEQQQLQLQQQYQNEHPSQSQMNEQQMQYENNIDDTQQNQLQFEDDIAKLLQTIISIENEIEQQRDQLADNNKFCCNEAFRYLDQGGHGYIVADDLKVFFSNNHIAVHEHECDFLIYESTNKGTQLTFSDFLRIILPRQDLILREQCLLRRKPSVPGKQNELPFYLEEQLAKLLESEIHYLREIEAQKIDLLNKYTLNFRDAFNIITKDHDYINSKIMYQFMSQKYDNYEEQFYRYLEERLDKDKSKTLTIDEFCDAIFPSDFIQRPPQPQRQTKTFEELVYGDENQYINYLQRKPKPYQRPQQINSGDSTFKPEKYKFQNNINYVKFNNNNNNNGTMRKFLRTNLQFEKSFNLSPGQNNYHQHFQNTTEGIDNEIPQSPYRNNLLNQHRTPVQQNLQYKNNTQENQIDQFQQQTSTYPKNTNKYEDEDIAYTGGFTQPYNVNQPIQNQHQQIPSYQRQLDPNQQQIQYQQQYTYNQQQVNPYYESQTSSNEEKNKIFLNNPQQIINQNPQAQYNTHLIPENQSYNYN